MFGFCSMPRFLGKLRPFERPSHHRAIFNPASDPSSTKAFITRTSVLPATWTMVSNGPCVLNPNVGGVWSQDLVRKNAPLIFRGYYNLQFSIRLRAK